MIETKKANSVEEFTNLVLNLSGELQGFAYKRTNDWDLAKDLVQDSFLSAHKSWDGFKNKSSRKTWIYQILRNKIIDHYRSAFNNYHVNATQSDVFDDKGHWLESESPVAWNAGPEQMQSDEFNAVLLSCTEGLTEQQRIVFNLKYIDDKDSDEICKDLGMTASNYWVTVHRAKLKLRKCLEKNWFVNA